MSEPIKKKKRKKTAPINIERKFTEQEKIYIIGIDEAGKGPMFGSAYVGWGIFPFHKYTDDEQLLDNMEGLKDSKKYPNHKARLQHLIHIKTIEPDIMGDVQEIPASMIDKYGISMCIRWAVLQCIDVALSRLELIYHTHQNTYKTPVEPTHDNIIVMCDGGIWGMKHPEPYSFVHCYNKGDNLSMSIALGALHAKVARDVHVLARHKLHPEYNLDKTKGYWSSQTNADMIVEKAKSITGIHRDFRRSFNPLKDAINWHQPMTYGMQPPVEFHSHILRSITIPDIT